MNSFVALILKDNQVRHSKEINQPLSSSVTLYWSPQFTTIKCILLPRCKLFVPCYCTTPCPLH